MRSFVTLPAQAWASLLMLGSVPAVAGPYDAQALRGDLSPLPYFATAGGREGKRFADGEGSRYRLYDFYARQAEHELANPPDPSGVLPPFPGLDGGRHGHWGATNEKESIAFPRDRGPDFTTVTARKGKGEFHLLAGPLDDPSVVVFDGIGDGLKAFYPKARMRIPEHPFGQAVDRFGFNLEVEGGVLLAGPQGEWSREGKKIGRFAGYYLQGNSAVFRSEIGDITVLDRPSVVLPKDRSDRFLKRHFEFSEGVSAAIDFGLPHPGGIAGADGSGVVASSPSSAGDGSVLVQFLAGPFASLHRVCGTGGVKFESVGSGIRITEAPAHGRLVVISWAGPVAEVSLARQALESTGDPLSGEPPGSCLQGGPGRFPEVCRVTGRMNADPEASGGRYEVDDIPVPSGNPYRTPMTLSGIAFADDGTAYVCTLVGDVWKVSGLHGELQRIEWKRYASGLDLPMGIEVVDGVPYVNVRRFILRLKDLNGDGEADHYERFNRMDLPTADECGRDLKRDAAGNFCFNTAGGIYRLSADGTDLRKIGHGARNPLGLGVRKDGLVLSDSSEGNLGNGTCTIFESDHPENIHSESKLRRILYLPRGVDNSPGSRLFPDEPRFGPLGSAILGTSFATGTWYYLLRNETEGTPQAAMAPMPGRFSSGACRIAVQPLDGQVFVAGLDGWGDYAVAEGCLHRIRHTGRGGPVLSGWQACRNGVMLEFDRPLGESPPSDGLFVQQWNYLDSQMTYGSPEYSVKFPDRIGHDRLAVKSVRILPDGRSLFLEIPELLPAMCVQVHGRLRDASGTPFPLDLYLTVNRLRADHPAAPAVSAAKPTVLAVPEKEQNGDTYQSLVEHFDRLAGRDAVARPAGPSVSYRKEELTYDWIRDHLVNPQCMPCHGPGTQHDLTSYDGMLRKIDLKHPAKSPILGMIDTNSMPPYPLPVVATSMREALVEWIKAGAPR